jgi:hypothetical protein
VFDVRPVTARVPGVIFTQADLMQAPEAMSAGGCCDSLSCLHALEHFGLGRYGDPLDAQGYRRGLANLANLLERGGTLYLSVPVGAERVEFNANWVFDPDTITGAAAQYGLELQRLMTIDGGGTTDHGLPDGHILALLSAQRYTLGLFVFTKR